MPTKNFWFKLGEIGGQNDLASDIGDTFSNLVRPAINIYIKLLRNRNGKMYQERFKISNCNFINMYHKFINTFWLNFIFFLYVQYLDLNLFQ